MNNLLSTVYKGLITANNIKLIYKLLILDLLNEDATDDELENLYEKIQDDNSFNRLLDELYMVLEGIANNE